MVKDSKVTLGCPVRFVRYGLSDATHLGFQSVRGSVFANTPFFLLRIPVRFPGLPDPAPPWGSPYLVSTPTTEELFLPPVLASWMPICQKIHTSISVVWVKKKKFIPVQLLSHFMDSKLQV